MQRFDHNYIQANTERFVRAGLDTSFLEDMAKIISALHGAGFDPYDQLTGFVRTGNPQYITRSGGARELVQKLDAQHIRTFLARYREHE